MSTRDPAALLEACRAPDELAGQEAWLWIIRQHRIPPTWRRLVQATGLSTGDRFTGLYRVTDASIHVGGECVMDDSPRELRRHLPILVRARGRVLVTGLGLGCVVRGLLSIPEVTHIDVVEIDRHVLDLVGPEFADEERVELHHGDAARLPWPQDQEWDWAWHDLWTEHKKGALDILHVIVLRRYERMVRRGQGAWMLHRPVKRRLRSVGMELIG